MPINYSKWDDIGSSDDEANDAADRRDVEAMLRGAVDMDPMERKFYEARLGEERVRPPPPPGAVSRVQASGADAARRASIVEGVDRSFPPGASVCSEAGDLRRRWGSGSTERVPRSPWRLGCVRRRVSESWGAFVESQTTTTFPRTEQRKRATSDGQTPRSIFVDV